MLFVTFGYARRRTDPAAYNEQFFFDSNMGDSARGATPSPTSKRRLH